MNHVPKRKKNVANKRDFHEPVGLPWTVDSGAWIQIEGRSTLFCSLWPLKGLRNILMFDGYPKVDSLHIER